MRCSNCSQRIEIRSGARTYFKCELLNKFMDFETEHLNECPLTRKDKCNKK